MDPDNDLLNDSRNPQRYSTLYGSGHMNRRGPQAQGMDSLANSAASADGDFQTLQLPKIETNSMDGGAATSNR